MSAPSMAAAAVAYAARLTWRVFPVHTVAGGRCSCRNLECKHAGKHPRIAHGLRAAIKDEEQIRGWWRWWPDMNIGIATGEASGFFALDVDPDHGGDDTPRELENQHGALPATVRQITGSGGEHILFRHVAGLRNSAGRRGPGLDIRSDGGYVVVPPSAHVSGRRYAWSVDHHPLEARIAEAPPWVLALLTAAGQQTAPSASVRERWIEALSAPCNEGERNDTLARLAGHLLCRYIDPYVVLEIARNWNAVRCRPPLDDAEVRRTVDSICMREARRRQAIHG